jgi:glycosyltransferase involved in cell wall biosynthesis
MKYIKVCHITSAHSRYDTRIFHKECKTLAKNAYSVSLIVNDLKENEILDSINIISTKFQPKNRYDRMIKSLRKIKKLVLEIDADIYHLHDPELFRIVKFLKKRNKKVIFDSHEDYSLTIETKTWIPKIFRKLVTRLYHIYENSIIAKLDGSLVCYHWTRDRYTKNLFNTELLFNFPVISDYLPIDIDYETNFIAYAGGISKQWNHSSLINSLCLTKNSFKYLLAGNSNEEYLAELKNLNGWKYVDYMGRLDYDKVFTQIYSNSSIGVALLDYIPQCKKTVGNLSNTKLFEFMLLKLPLICTDFDLWRDIIENEKCGILVNPRKPEDIATALDFLANNPEKAKEMGENGYRAIINKYNWESDSKNLIKVYKRIEENL